MGAQQGTSGWWQSHRGSLNLARVTQSRGHVLAGGTQGTEGPCTSPRAGSARGTGHCPHSLPGKFSVIVPQLGIKPARSSLAQPAEHAQDQD